jgi:hypothetical protein
MMDPSVSSSSKLPKSTLDFLHSAFSPRHLLTEFGFLVKFEKRILCDASTSEMKLIMDRLKQMQAACDLSRPLDKRHPKRAPDVSLMANRFEEHMKLKQSTNINTGSSPDVIPLKVSCFTSRL